MSHRSWLRLLRPGALDRGRLPSGKVGQVGHGVWAGVALTPNHLGSLVSAVPPGGLSILPWLHALRNSPRHPKPLA